MIGRSYTQNSLNVQYIIIQGILGRKSMKKCAVTDEKCSVYVRLLTLKDNSYADMRTSHAQLLEKGCQHGDKGSNNKTFHKKSRSLVKKSR